MRLLSLLFLSALLTASAAFSQPFSFGIKGGLPLTDFVHAVSSGTSFTATTNTNRYIIGPTAELRLPFGLGVEADILYRHFSFGSTLVQTANTVTSETTTGAWEFPLLAKYRFKGKFFRPYVDGGVAWDKLSGVTSTIQSTINLVTNSGSTSNPLSLKDGTTRGFVLGGGVDIKVLLIHVSPEIRYTHWGAKHFIESGSLSSKQSQAEFLVGITF